MIRPYVLAETNWKHLKDEQIEIAVLPWGATEAHNYHLPYATDNIEADAIAHEAARLSWEQGVKIIVLPTVPFGVNTGQTDIYLDINIQPSTQLSILDNIIEVLNRQGIKKLVVFNSHGGNDFKTMLRELGVKYPEMLLCQTHWFRALDKTKYFEEAGDHADEMETSLIMYLKPELVLPLDQAGEGPVKKHRVSALNESWAWAERKWSQVTEDTGVGNPKKSSTEKGAQFFKDLTEKISVFFIELAGVKIGDLYE